MPCAAAFCGRRSPWPGSARANLVHRDVKPSNLLVMAAGTPAEIVTLLDFGISRILDDDNEITSTGEIVGTIAYCSPEQLSRQPISAACDQYSLACVAYECLTGEVPFVREGQLALMIAHLAAAPPRASAVRPDRRRGPPTRVRRRDPTCSRCSTPGSLPWTWPRSPEPPGSVSVSWP